jgi:hypothetical protein
MKCQVNEMLSLMKWQVDKMASQWNGKLMKIHIDEMHIEKLLSWKSGKLTQTQCHVDEMSNWWNDKLTK